MDIEKEREAFEREFKTRWEIGHFILKMVEFVDESQDYAPVNAVKQLSDEYYWVLALNTGWWAWQAAKAQAIPEGFVVVPKEPNKQFKNVLSHYLDELCRGGYGCDLDGFVSVNGIDSDQVWKMVIDTKAMIEAQEPAK